MIFMPGLVTTDLEGKMGDWYIIHRKGKPPICALHPKHFHKVPAAWSDPQYAFHMADKLYTSLTPEQRDPWTAYANKYRKNPYILFMSGTVMNWLDGLYAPDYPPDRDPCKSYPTLPGSRYPPPERLRTRKHQSCAGKVKIDMTANYDGSYDIEYAQFLIDAESIDPFPTRQVLDALWDPRTQHYAFHKVFDCPNQARKHFTTPAQWPPPAYDESAELGQAFAAWRAKQPFKNHEVRNVPFPPAVGPDFAGIAVPGKPNFEFKHKKTVLPDYRFEGSVRFWIRKFRFRPPYTYIHIEIYCTTVGYPYWSKQIGRGHFRAFYDTINHNYIFDRYYDIPKATSIRIFAKTANPVLPRYHWSCEYKGNRVYQPLKHGLFYAWDTRLL